MTRVLTGERLTSGGRIAVVGDEWKYLVKVRRHRVGDTVQLVDPDGRCFEAILEALPKGEAVFLVGEGVGSVPAPLPVHLMVSVPKRNLFDDVVRKVNELGIARITPVASSRTQFSPGDPRLERWRRIAVESSRQCGRTVPLIVDDIVSLGESLADLPPEGTRFILHPGEGSSPAGALMPQRFPTPVTILVGPEGGFTESEVDAAISYKFQSVRFGESILRIETAAICAAFLANTLTGGLD